MRKAKILVQILLCLSSSALCFAAIQAPQATTPDPEDIEKFGLAFGEIKQFYVSDKKDKDLFDSAIRGMLQGLDPHSQYLDEETYAEFMNQSNGNFVGVGIEVSTEKDTVKVISPLDGSPAAKAGVKPGDYIVAVDGKPVVDMPVDDIVKMIRGKPGTKVTLTVINKEEKKPRQLSMTREKLDIQSVKSKLLPDDFGYIRVSQFQEKTEDGVKQAMIDLNKQANGHLQGVILDLRNDPGGLLSSAVGVADIFLDANKLGNNKKIVYTKGRFPESSSTFNATPGDMLNGKPIVVLINSGSASGSEIVAGALQDHRRAIILGQKSFGKGSVQTLLPLDNKTAIKLTTALYYTPSGKSIQAEGIKPDVLVEDLKIKKDDEDAAFFLQIREDQLKGHLQNASGTAQDKVDLKQTKDLAAEDFQLHEALMVVKALKLANKTTLEDV